MSNTVGEIDNLYLRCLDNFNYWVEQLEITKNKNCLYYAFEFMKIMDELLIMKMDFLTKIESELKNVHLHP
jgi:hypothetical protein